MPSRSMTRRLALPASALIALCAFVHACGGGGGSSSGDPPPPPGPPPPTSFVSTSQSPANSAVNVSRVPVILIGFNDIVNPATMNSTTVSLNLGAVAVNSTLTYIACNNRIQIIPNAALDPGLMYTVTLTSGLLDNDGEALTAISRTFTTTALGDTVRPTFTAAGFTGDPDVGAETNQVFLDWADGDDAPNMANTISYRVYVAISPGCFDYSNPVVTTGAGTTDAIVMGLNPRTLYSFVVRAVDAAGNESLNTDQVDVTTFTSFAVNVFPLVTNLCVSCHNPPNGQAVLAGINMDYSTSATVYNSWVGVARQCAGGAGFASRVVAGDASTSFLWNKISGLPAGVVCGDQMPQGQTPLSAANQDIIFDWINEGALNN